MTPFMFSPLGSGPERDRYLDLVARHFDGVLEPAESRELGHLLAADADLAREFARRSMFHGHIRAVLRLERELDGREGWSLSAKPAPAAASWRRPAAALVVLGLLVAVVGLVARPSRPVDVAEPAAVSVVPQPIAAIVASIDAVWSDSNIEFALRQGDIPSGLLTLLSGRVEFLFADGATAIIEGPATFAPVSGDTLRVEAGAVRCRCPRPGTELRVETPSGTVVDLGTEFAVSVEPNVRTRVGVIEGKVRVDGDGTSQLMSAGDAVSIDRSGESASDVGFLRDIAEQVTMTSVDPAVFESCPNALADPSFERESSGPEEADERRADSFRLGPWFGSLGYVGRVSRPVASGHYAVRISARGSRLWPLVGQAVQTGDIAGRPLMARTRACQPHDDPLAGNQCAILKLVFVDARGRHFASAERYFLRAGGVTGEFVETSIAAIAPEGTVAVQGQVLLNARGLPGGSIVVDDVAVMIGEIQTP